MENTYCFISGPGNWRLVQNTAIPMLLTHCQRQRAVAGVLGAYGLSFPEAKVRHLLF